MSILQRKSTRLLMGGGALFAACLVGRPIVANFADNGDDTTQDTIQQVSCSTDPGANAWNPVAYVDANKNGPKANCPKPAPAVN